MTGREVLEKLERREFTREVLKEALSINDRTFNEALFKLADEIRRKYVGDEVHIRAIIEFSNVCRKNCLYCGLRRDNKNLKRYRMTPEEIIERARLAVQFGAKTIVLQSGEDPYYMPNVISDIVREIKKMGVAVTLSLGEWPKEYYERWKEAGADRYLLRHETANPILHKKLRPDTSFENRVQCLLTLKGLGYETGAGSMVGLPGQTIDDLVDDLLFLKEHDFDMVGIGPFIPHPDTPLANEKKGDFTLTLKMVALTRILLPDSNIPATTAMGTIVPGGREITLRCGANVIMPNWTPSPYRQLYQLYPGKICVFEKDTACIPCVMKMIEHLGRKPGRDWGGRKRVFETV
jgi:biotin synthase